MTLLAITASPSDNSRSTRLADYAVSRLAGFKSQSLALRRLPAGPLLAADFEADGLREALRSVHEAHAVIIATPIYKASYAGLLKVFLDLLPQDGLAGKVVLPLATSGSLAHTLALDYGLRPVLAALGARVVVDSVVIQDQQISTGATGEFILDAEAAERLKRSVDHLRESVDWIQGATARPLQRPVTQKLTPVFAV